MRRAFLIRFDDVCPTMNWNVWAKVERVLIEAAVKPILAVVPDNRHPVLAHGPARESFWEEVARWRDRGWTIALHGYQHSELTRDGGLMGIVGWSEFAGLDEGTQQRRVEEGAKIFRSHGHAPHVWVAPGRSFDHKTLSVLTKVGISVLNDGFSLAPYRDAKGLIWVPQQLWRFRNVPFGVWTVALHINRWTDRDVKRFVRDVERFSPWITDLDSVVERYDGRSASRLDRLFSRAYGGAVRRRFSTKPSGPAAGVETEVQGI